MVVQVKQKVLVLDQPFLQPDAVRRVEVLEGLDSQKSAYPTQDRFRQPIPGQNGDSSGRVIVSRTFPCRSLVRGLRQPPGHAREGVLVPVERHGARANKSAP
jgi:hypothetical protein